MTWLALGICVWVTWLCVTSARAPELRFAYGRYFGGLAIVFGLASIVLALLAVDLSGLTFVSQ